MITAPSSNFKGYELLEWWQATQKFISGRGQVTYQLPDIEFTGGSGAESATTTTTDMYLGEADHLIIAVNPGVIYFPPAYAMQGKEYLIFCFKNPNVTWTGKTLELSPALGEYIAYRNTNIVMVNSGSDVQTFTRFVCDGINNWVLIP